MIDKDTLNECVSRVVNVTFLPTASSLGLHIACPEYPLAKNVHIKLTDENVTLWGVEVDFIKTRARIHNLKDCGVDLTWL